MAAELTTASKMTDEEKKGLIQALKERPSPWNTSLAVYRDKKIKFADSQTLSHQFNMTVEEMKKVLHSLRTSMTREVKRMQEDPTYVTRWKFFRD